VRLFVENDVFVHLVADEENVRVAQQGGQLPHVVGGEDGARGVVRRVDEQELVRGVMLRFNRSQSMAYVPGESGTRTATPPFSSMAGM
jgi:hypothetical protein